MAKEIIFQVCVLGLQSDSQTMTIMCPFFLVNQKKEMQPYQCSSDPETNGSYELLVLLNISKDKLPF